jgi:hypothetical protein
MQFSLNWLKEKEIEGPSPSQPIVKKGRRLQIAYEPKET